MSKKFTIGLLVFFAGVAGNLVAGWLQQGKWAIQPTTEQFLGTLAGAGLILFIVALLESERSLSWNWRWHRFWYLRELLKNPDLRHWETDFARLEMVQGRRKIFGAEVIAQGKRQGMVEVLRELIIGRQEKTPRVLVLGEPGSGKTTGLERLALDLARAGSRRLGVGYKMPVLLRLGNFQQGKLVDYVAQSMRHRTKRSSGKVLSKGVEKLMEQGCVVLLCDALDEALGERHEDVLKELAFFLESQAYHNVPIVITSRTREDPGGRLKGLTVFEIQDLSDEAVSAFIRAYNKQLEQSEAEIAQRLQNHRLLEPGGLGRNPFWLRLIVASGAFEGNKGQILNTAVDTLLAREWDEKPAVERSWRRVLPRDEQLEETKRALAFLGYWMSAGNLVAIEQDGVLMALEKGWLAKREQAGVKGLRPQDILGLGRDAQVLVYDAGPIRFRHRLLQEFMTAWILKTDERLLTQELERRIQDTDWWQTLLILGEITDDYQAFVRRILMDGNDIGRVFLAFGLLESDPIFALRKRLLEKVNRPLREFKQVILKLSPSRRWAELLFRISEFTRLTDTQHEVTLTLANCLSQGLTITHKHAFNKLNQIIGQEILDRLASFLLFKNIGIKNEVIELLKATEEPNVAEYFILMLGDETTKFVAREALVQIGTPAIEPLLLAMEWDAKGWFEEFIGKREKAEVELQQAKVSITKSLDEIEKITDEKMAKQLLGQSQKQLQFIEANQQLLIEIERPLQSVKQFQENLPQLFKQMAQNFAQKCEQENMPDVGQALTQAVSETANVEELFSEYAPDFQFVIDTLVEIGESVVEPLIHALNRDLLFEKNIHVGAAKALAKIGSPKAIDALVGRLGSDDFTLADDIAEALKETGISIFDALISAMDSDDQRTCSNAFNIVRNIGQPALAPLTTALREGRINTSYGTPLLIEIAGKPENLDFVITMLKSDNLDLQLIADSALRKIGEPAIDNLMALIGDEGLSHKVTSTLAAIGSTTVVEPLTEALSHRNARVRAGAVNTLQAIAWQYGIKDARTIQSLVNAIKDSDLLVSIQACFTLAQIGNPAMEPLCRLLNDEDKNIRLRVVDCLKKMNIVHHNNVNVTKPLIQAINDRETAIRQQAIFALGLAGDLTALKPLIYNLFLKPQLHHKSILLTVTKIVFRSIFRFRLKSLKRRRQRIN